MKKLLAFAVLTSFVFASGLGLTSCGSSGGGSNNNITNGPEDPGTGNIRGFWLNINIADETFYGYSFCEEIYHTFNADGSGAKGTFTCTAAQITFNQTHTSFDMESEIFVAAPATFTYNYSINTTVNPKELTINGDTFKYFMDIVDNSGKGFWY